MRNRPPILVITQHQVIFKTGCWTMSMELFRRVLSLPIFPWTQPTRATDKVSKSHPVCHGHDRTSCAGDITPWSPRLPPDGRTTLAYDTAWYARDVRDGFHWFLRIPHFGGVVRRQGDDPLFVRHVDSLFIWMRWALEIQRESILSYLSALLSFIHFIPSSSSLFSPLKQ